ncbi:DUF1799 domain-containing protein [Methylobacterium goesingense]|uniref:Uncharacterized protein n=1 Tax=Methylobacterium goesingense TaxID=243690 RepID=A0ABV2L3C3_9HYPH|nr:DUF1799 domain-containing protein [Methylobacterium goesingense]
MTWAVLERCGGQVRAGMGSPYALDFTAVLLLADAMGARTALLADVLPSVEAVIVKAYREESENAD